MESYTYEFANETVEVEIDEKWASVLKEMDLEYEPIERKETRRQVPLDTSFGWSDWLIDDDDPEESIIEMIESRAGLDLAMSVLNEKQQALIRGLFLEGLTHKEYAKRVGVERSAVTHQVDTIRKKLKKYF